MEAKFPPELHTISFLDREVAYSNIIQTLTISQIAKLPTPDSLIMICINISTISQFVRLNIFILFHKRAY